MKTNLFKQLLFTWIMLALLTACATAPSANANVLMTKPPATVVVAAEPTATLQPQALATLPSVLSVTQTLPTATAVTIASLPPFDLATATPAANVSSTDIPPTWTSLRIPAYWPTQGWHSSSPEMQGMDSAQIDLGLDAIQKTGENLHSLLIIRNGTIVTEIYTEPFRPDARTNLNTSQEVVVATLIGIAIQQGLIKSVDQKMLDFFPDRKTSSMDPHLQAITIRELLTMTSGLVGDDDNLFSADDAVQFALEVGTIGDPGTNMIQNWSGYQLLTAIIQKTTGMTTLDYANKVLFGPLGISGAGWLADPKGVNYGGSYLYLTPRDIAKIGYLYLNQGVWNDQQIVPKAFVHTATQHLVDTVYHSTGWGFGYGWFIGPDGSFSAEGFAGQLISVQPKPGIVTVFNAGAPDDFSLKEEDIVNNFIVKAVKSDGLLPENPGSEALLKAKIVALQKTAPQPVPTYPKIAATISSKKYLLDDGETVKLSFTTDQATLDWSSKDQSMSFPIGMDGVFRTTPMNQTKSLSLLGASQAALGQIFLAFKGDWKADGNFELTLQILNSLQSHTIDFTFTDDKVKIVHSDTENSDTLTFLGQIQAP